MTQVGGHDTPRDQLAAMSVGDRGGRSNGTAPTAAGVADGCLLALQRGAGNAAVAGLLNAQRQRGPGGGTQATAVDVNLPFTSLREGAVLADPGRRAGPVRIQRRGEDLYYFIGRDPTPRRVPRPVAPGSTPPTPVGILTVTWAPRGLPQVAFRVTYGQPLSSELAGMPVLVSDFFVNTFGRGTHQDSSAVAPMARTPPPAALEVFPAGLEIERSAGVLTPRPSGRRGPLPGTRYHWPGAPTSLYLSGSSTQEARVVDDATGAVVWRPSGTLTALDVQPDGRVLVAWRQGGMEQELEGDLRVPSFVAAGSPPPRRVALSAARSAATQRLVMLGVRVVERGSRFTETELATAADVLERFPASQSPVTALRRRGLRLTLVKELSRTGGQYETDVAEIRIPGYVGASTAEQRNTVIHEVTHALEHAAGLMILSSERQPADAVALATTIAAASSSGVMHLGPDPRGPTYRQPSQQAIAGMLSRDPVINRLWVALHARFRISDPEGTGDVRGLDVADESRYLGREAPRGELVGHGFESVPEFLSSFVATTLQYQSQMVATVRAAGDATLASLYRQVWDWTNTHLVPLGSRNPY